MKKLIILIAIVACVGCQSEPTLDIEKGNAENRLNIIRQNSLADSLARIPDTVYADTLIISPYWVCVGTTISLRAKNGNYTPVFELIHRPGLNTDINMLMYSNQYPKTGTQLVMEIVEMLNREVKPE